MQTFFLLVFIVATVSPADDDWLEDGYKFCETQENEIGVLKGEIKSLKGENGAMKGQLEKLRQQFQKQGGSTETQKKGLISKGKRVFGSAIHDFYVPDNILDGDLQSIGHTLNGDSYFVVALLGTYYVTNVTVFLSNSHGKDYSLPLNVDARLFNNDWMSCGSIRDEAVMGKSYKVSCRGMLASQVKLSKQGYLSLAEVEIYGDPADMGHELLSRGKPASQSSTHSFFNASVSVDGKVNSAFSHTGQDSPPWWQVDLQGEYRIYTVRIFCIPVCPGCGPRLNTLQVFTRSSESDSWLFCGKLNEPGGAVMSGVYEINCKGMIASQVRLQLTIKEYLHFTEVEVYGKRL